MGLTECEYFIFVFNNVYVFLKDKKKQFLV